MSPYLRVDVDASGYSTLVLFRVCSSLATDAMCTTGWREHDADEVEGESLCGLTGVHTPLGKFSFLAPLMVSFIPFGCTWESRKHPLPEPREEKRPVGGGSEVEGRGGVRVFV